MDKPVESWEPVFMEWLDLKVELVILKKSVDDEICTHTQPHEYTLPFRAPSEAEPLNS